MTSDAYPIHEIHEEISALRRWGRAVRALVFRVASLDVQYVDPWERKRR